MLGLSENLFEPEPKHGVLIIRMKIEAVRYQIKHGAKGLLKFTPAGVMSLEDLVGAQQLQR